MISSMLGLCRRRELRCQVTIGIALLRPVTTEHWQDIRPPVAFIGQEARRFGSDMEEAAIATRAALEVYTRQEYPVEWARAHSNLGSIFKHLAELWEGEAALRCVREATAALKRALDVYGDDEFSLKRAGVLQGLAAAWLKEGVLVGAPDELESLLRAAAACEEGLGLVAKEKHPLVWAALQHNLGPVLLNSGSWTGGTEDVAEAEWAVAAFRGSLDIYGQDAHPAQRAEAHRCLALAHELVGDLGVEDASPHYREALAHARTTLEGIQCHLPRSDADDVVEVEQRLVAKLAEVD